MNPTTVWASWTIDGQLGLFSKVHLFRDGQTWPACGVAYYPDPGSPGSNEEYKHPVDVNRYPGDVCRRCAAIAKKEARRTQG